MRILVTGAAGFIGSNLVKALENHFPTYEIYALDDFSSGHFKNLLGFKGEVITADISCKEVWERLKDYRFDVIFHEGAISDTRVLDQGLVMRVNTESFKYLLDLAKCSKSKVIYASSAAVYGNSPAPQKEDEGLVPENVYGFSKYAMDMIALKFMEINPDIQVCGMRYFNVYGPGEDFKGEYASMIRQMFMRIKKGQNPRLFKYGEQKRDFVYIKDVINANIKAMESDVSGIFNIATGVARSFNDIVKIISDVTKKDINVEYFDCPYDFYQNLTQADISRAKSFLGYIPEYDLETGIKEYINYLEKF
ncbi:ADP-L-glycero-D-manno-heptose-6-epimerase [Thermodesulfobium narugense DSM 14796]|uniref:ADP-L-glycero-D-manno-heptose-6-epimerase n=1 Tax=Thermodesulfobium narugense DSM 14796 TaxID=747365 RepID=M1E533_9BACT|nr:ADP-glyceromanno-heptose 6-epimerase [Thermodesulfobium narugense]AEE13981.1 ADP-L-glycero-D-manno-heptose-6-epimerase [Thermodesulfobium narugense DSM 14796]